GAGRRRSRALAVAGWIVVAIAAVLAVGATSHLVHVAQVRAKYPPPGKLVDVGGYRIHVLAEGDAGGRPPIVWMPGGHGGGFAFHHLHAALRDEARSILIDRPGSGWSDPGPFPRTTPREVEEVVAALRAAGERGPFVFAGHSFGGLLLANVARRYPESTAAVVLIDATPPDAINYAPPNPFIDDMFREATLNVFLRAFGIRRDLAQRLFGEELPPEFQRVTRIIEQQLGDAGRALRAIEDAPRAPAASRSSFEELRRGGLGYEETVYDGDLLDLPVYLVAPPRMAEFETVAKEIIGGPEERAKRDAIRLQRFYTLTRERYMHVSSRSVRVFAPDGSGHNFPYEHPEFMVETIRRVLTDVAAPAGAAAQVDVAAASGAASAAATAVAAP
ncbi:MAG: alpha/beta fold hydrolase, partial [Pseudomonadota bacterium]